MLSDTERNVDRQKVAKLAEIAGLQVRPDRLEALTSRYSAYLDELEKLRDLDIDDQEPVFIFRAEENLP